MFDRIEELSGTPRQFCWAKNAGLMTYTQEEYLYEGELLQFKAAHSQYQVNRYVLTIQALIKYKVSRHLTEQRKSPTIPKCALRLSNPRIEKVDDPQSSRCHHIDRL